MKPKHFPIITIAAAAALTAVPLCVLLWHPRFRSPDDNQPGSDSVGTITAAAPSAPHFSDIQAPPHSPTPSAAAVWPPGVVSDGQQQDDAEQHSDAASPPSVVQTEETASAEMESESTTAVIAADAPSAEQPPLMESILTALRSMSSAAATDKPLQDEAAQALDSSSPEILAAHQPGRDSPGDRGMKPSLPTSTGTEDDAAHRPAMKRVAPPLPPEAVRDTEQTKISSRGSVDRRASRGRGSRQSGETDHPPESSPASDASSSNVSFGDFASPMGRSDESSGHPDPALIVDNVSIQSPVAGRPVNRMENVVACATAVGWPVALIKSDLPDDVWWVQQMVGIRGNAFAARVNFGNEYTLPGSSFRMVIIFLDSADEVRRFQIARQFKDIPEGVRRSQEFVYVRR